MNERPISPEWQLSQEPTPAVNTGKLGETTGAFGPAGQDERLTPAVQDRELSGASVAPETPVASPVNEGGVAENQSLSATPEVSGVAPVEVDKPASTSELSLTDSEINEAVKRAKPTPNSMDYDYRALFDALYDARKLREGKIYDQAARQLGRATLTEQERVNLLPKAMENRDLTDTEMNRLIAQVQQSGNGTFDQAQWEQYLHRTSQEPVFPN